MSCTDSTGEAMDARECVPFKGTLLVEPLTADGGLQGSFPPCLGGLQWATVAGSSEWREGDEEEIKSRIVLGHLVATVHPSSVRSPAHKRWADQGEIMNGYDAINSGLPTLQGEIAVAAGVQYEDITYIGNEEYHIDGMPWFEWIAAMYETGSK